MKPILTTDHFFLKLIGLATQFLQLKRALDRGTEAGLNRTYSQYFSSSLLLSKFYILLFPGMRYYAGNTHAMMKQYYLYNWNGDFDIPNAFVMIHCIYLK